MDEVKKEANYLGVAKWDIFRGSLNPEIFEEFSKNVKKHFKYFHYDGFENYSYSFDPAEFHIKELNTFWHYAMPNIKEAPDSEIENLTKDQEKELFTHYNYCKYRFYLVAQKVMEFDATEEDLKDAIFWKNESFQVKEVITLYNAKLVYYIYSNYWAMSHMSLGDFWGDALENLVKAVDSFDFSCDNKFSTYACVSLKRCFGRQYQKHLHQSHLPIDGDVHVFQNDLELESKISKTDVFDTVSEKELLEKIKEMLSDDNHGLDKLEKDVLVSIFYKGMTLKDTAKVLRKNKNNVAACRDKALRKMLDLIS